MQSTPIQTRTPAHKKSHKVLIVSLVIVFVIMPLVFGAVSLALLSSMRLCSGLVRTGNEVSALLAPNLKLATYNYQCLSNTPPTAQHQYISLGLLSDATYESRSAFLDVVTGDLARGGWKLTASPNDTPETSVVYAKNSYTATIAINSYQPAYGKVTLRSDAPRTNFGLVFEKAPDVPRELTNEQQLLFITAPIYVSEYIPTGYSAWKVKTTGISGEIPNVSLVGNQKGVMPELRVTAMNPGYDITAGKTPLTTTKDGVTLYTTTSESSPRRYDVAAVVGSNVVTLAYANQHPNVVTQLSTEQITSIFESLKQTNTPAK